MLSNCKPCNPSDVPYALGPTKLLRKASLSPSFRGYCKPSARARSAFSREGPSASRCPSIASRCPSIASRCPSIASRCPSIASRCPSIASRCPSIASRCPSIASRCPSNVRKPLSLNCKPLSPRFDQAPLTRALRPRPLALLLRRELGVPAPSPRTAWSLARTATSRASSRTGVRRFFGVGARDPHRTSFRAEFPPHPAALGRRRLCRSRREARPSKNLSREKHARVGHRTATGTAHDSSVFRLAIARGTPRTQKHPSLMKIVLCAHSIISVLRGDQCRASADCGPSSRTKR